MTPGAPQLHAMSVGELLDATFRLYRQRLAFFIGLIAVIQIPMFLLGQVLQVLFYHTLSGRGRYYFLLAAGPSSVQSVVTVCTFFVVQGLTSGAMARAVYDNYLGQPQGLLGTCRSIGRRWPRLLAALAVLGLLDLGIAIAFIALASVTGSGVGMGLVCLGWILGVAILACINIPILSLLAPVIVIENEGIITGLRRAFDLGRRKFWRVLGINFLLWLLNTIISQSLSFLVVIVLTPWMPGGVLIVVALLLAYTVVPLLVKPIWVCSLALLYFDLRVRLEGFDLELMVEQMNTEQGQAWR